jgi:predicted CopG family antitoxin
MYIKNLIKKLFKKKQRIDASINVFDLYKHENIKDCFEEFRRHFKTSSIFS